MCEHKEKASVLHLNSCTRINKLTIFLANEKHRFKQHVNTVELFPSSKIQQINRGTVGL